MNYPDDFVDNVHDAIIDNLKDEDEHWREILENTKKQKNFSGMAIAKSKLKNISNYANRLLGNYKLIIK